MRKTAQRVDKTCVLCGAQMVRVHYNAKYCESCRRTMRNSTKARWAEITAGHSPADRRKGPTLRQIVRQAAAEGLSYGQYCVRHGLYN